MRFQRLLLGIVFQQIAVANAAFTKQAEMEFTNGGNAQAVAKWREVFSYGTDRPPLRRNPMTKDLVRPSLR